MRKLIKHILQLVLLICVITGVIFTYKGVELYHDTMDEVVIEEVVFEIKKNENYVNIENISLDFLDILVTVEDRRFYDHSGFDFISFSRAIVRNLKQNEFAAGGSTITQQLAKNLFFSFDKKIERKVAEFIVAKQIESKYDKDEILEMYVNIIYFGDNHEGIKDASEGYFGISPFELSKAQIILLAGLPQAPSKYALSTNLNEAIYRSDQVLEVLLERNKITQQEMGILKDEIRRINIK